MKFFRYSSLLYSMRQNDRAYIIQDHKKVNSAGLQIADLVAHPIGWHVINPEQENRSYNILEKKFYRYPYHGCKGLKIFPKECLKSEKPQYTPSKTPTRNPQST